MNKCGQEEETRQNMEEVQATQWELQRKVQEYNERIHEKELQIKLLKNKVSPKQAYSEDTQLKATDVR